MHLINQNRQSSKIFSCLYDRNYGLFHEEYFDNLLRMEIKRTERSKKPFLVMLLDIERLNDNKERNGIIRKIIEIIFYSTREIDTKGWFKENSIIGIIFPETNTVEKQLLKDKIINQLYNGLSKELVDNIEISCYCFPDEYNEHFYRNLLKRNSQGKTHLFLKRVIDISGSILALLIFSPLFIIIALLIKVSSEGPVLFKQERLGHFGKKFIFLKFRTMYINSSPDIHKEYIKKFICEQRSYDRRKVHNKEEVVYKINEDPRITPIGKFLRKTSLDELPQFINVLKGEMSLVGPRPPIPYEVENYDLWHRRRLLEVKPGITGLWQVKGRSSVSFDEMVRLDLRYIREWSLWLDIKILLQTPKAVLSLKGAY